MKSFFAIHPSARSGRTAISLRWLVLAALIPLVLSGCGSKGGVAEGDGAAATAGSAARNPGGPRGGRYGVNGYGDEGYGARGRGAGGELDDPSGPLAQRVVYFQYDSYEVLPEYQPVVRAHAGYLAAHPDQNAVLEGHADERGSPEYNVALAEQRAKAVQRVMQLQGVGDGQLEVVSFGEEKPAAEGHDDASWQRNRRVEITYPGH